MQSTQAGQKFLADAAKKYDAILAFDHRTLGVSPMINARELALLTNRSRASIDIVCHSRGGLVARWWAEAFDQVRGRRRRIMFVGSPLAGTGLAAPPNIRKTMNLLASLAKAVGMGTAAVPFLTVVSILSQISGSITSIVARTPVVDATVALVPGLDAMSRVGNNHELLSIRRDPAAADSYFAVISNFESEKVGWRFWKVFKGPGIRLLDLGADVIFSGPNDLVVDTESMTSLADEINMKMENVLDFGTTDTVYHTNYFQQKATMDFLARILLN